MLDRELISHQQWLENTTIELQTLSQTATLDARVLLAHCLQKPISYLLTWPDRTINQDILEKLNALKQRRLMGEPIAYLTGLREFWSLNFKVNADVLIPRPETEHLVEWALQCIGKFETESGSDIGSDFKMLELGTGSGAIAIAVAKENPHLQITATDKSQKALQIAKENALLNQCENVTFLSGHWFDCVPDKDFDVILSNPPYIAAADPHLNEGDLPYEPVSALVADEKGLADIKWLIENAKKYLKQGGWLGIEHGFDQARAVLNMMQENGYQQSRTIQDLAGMDRLTVCNWSEHNE